MQDTELRKLVRGVRLLSLDAGNTVIFLDHARLARWAAERGFAVTAGTLIRTEGEAKLLQERGKMLDVAWDGRHLPGALGWGRTVGTILHRAGVPEDTVRDWLGALWLDHVRYNLWSLVPDGLGEALEAARGRGVRVAVVSNSEGMLDELFVALGIRRTNRPLARQRQDRHREARPEDLPDGARCLRAPPGRGAAPRRLDCDRRGRGARGGNARRARRPARALRGEGGGRAARHGRGRGRKGGGGGGG